MFITIFNPMKKTIRAFKTVHINHSVILALLLVCCSGIRMMAQCSPDVTPPLCVPPSDISISCEGYDPSFWIYDNAQVSDNCGIDSTKIYHNAFALTHTANFSQFDTLCYKGTISRVFTAWDEAGNTSSCSQKITVSYNQSYYVHFPNDVFVTGTYSWPLANYSQPSFFGEDCELLGTSYNDVILLDTGVIRVVRTWTIINWCTYDPALPIISVPNPAPNPIFNHVANRPGPIVSPGGANVPPNWQPTIVKVNAADPSPTDYSIFYDKEANGYEYVQFLYLLDTVSSGVEGDVFLDGNGNCSKDAGEAPLANWKVKAISAISGSVYNTITDSNGHYLLPIGSFEDSVTVMVDVPINLSQSCPTEFTVDLLADSIIVQDFSIVLEDTCQLLSVDLGAPFLRRCMDNNYSVQACNLGNTAVTGVYVDITLDQYLTYQNSTVFATSLGNNQYRFQLGNLDPGECNVFNIGVLVNCTAPLGATHCTEAQIFPNEPCQNFQNWNGAIVKVKGFCEGDSVRMEIKNIGTAPTAPMLDFIVVEDIIMMYNNTGSFTLQPEEIKPVKLPANGATWRLEAEQQPGYPWGGLTSATVEGCGGINIPGLVTYFPVSSSSPYESTDCQENIGSFDPNDKQAVPKGYGENHLLRANTDIDYTIRFQNTGTDTAFTVVIRDTLSPFLDPQSVRPGVGSHPYSFSMLDGNILVFRFDNILLPDSNVNEVASHGFIKFNVAQKPDNPNGTIIDNAAAIYFDFNEPVITNVVSHTIGENFIISQTTQPGAAALPLKIYPNPATEQATFEIPGGVLSGQFQLSNSTGQLLYSEIFNSAQYRLRAKGLNAGIYLYQITCDNGALYSGKLIVR